MSLEPDVVDLRSSDPEPDRTPDPRASPRRSAVLGGIALLVLGIAIGWLLAGDDGADEPAPAASEPAPDATPPPLVRESDAGAPDAAPLADERQDGGPPIGSGLLTDPPGSGRQPVLVASITPLADVARLAGPIRLTPGMDAAVELGLDAAGSVSIGAAGTRADSGAGLPPEAPRGIPLRGVADGLLFVPTDYALGAVAYWSPRSRTALPVPDAPYGTSYLSARGDLGVFLSGDEVVVRDLRRFADVLRVDRFISDMPIIGAWVDPSGSAVVMVSREGLGRAVAFADGTTLVEFTTDTPLRGVAWTGPDQLAFLVTDDGRQLVRALDVTSGATWDVAGLEAGSTWRIVAQP